MNASYNNSDLPTPKLLLPGNLKKCNKNIFKKNGIFPFLRTKIPKFPKPYCAHEAFLQNLIGLYSVYTDCSRFLLSNIFLNKNICCNVNISSDLKEHTESVRKNLRCHWVHGWPVCDEPQIFYRANWFARYIPSSYDDGAPEMLLEKDWLICNKSLCQEADNVFSHLEQCGKEIMNNNSDLLYSAFYKSVRESLKADTEFIKSIRAQCVMDVFKDSGITRDKAAQALLITERNNRDVLVKQIDVERYCSMYKIFNQYDLGVNSTGQFVAQNYTVPAKPPKIDDNFYDFLINETTKNVRKSIMEQKRKKISL